MKTIIFDTSAIVPAITGGVNFTQDLLLLADKKFVKLVASNETIKELKTALKYPKIAKNIKPDLKHYLDIYLKNVEVLQVPKTTKSLAVGTTKDPKDDMFIALAEYSKADFLISLDRKHLVSLKKWKNTQIVLPPLAVLGVAKDFGFEWGKEQTLANWWKKIESKILKS